MNLLTKSGLLPSLIVSSTSNEDWNRKRKEQMELETGENFIINKLVVRKIPFGIRSLVTDQYYAFHNGCDDYNISIFNYPFKYKPYLNTSACSVFCKHPTDPNTKKVLEKIKRMLSRQRNFCITGSTVTQNNSRNKMNFFGEAMMQSKWDHVFDMHDNGIEHSLFSNDENVEYNKEGVYVPEYLFRRYTETDSRPPTPSQMLTSTITAASTRAVVAANFFLTRRSNMAEKRNCRRRCITPDPVIDSTAVEKKLLVLDLRKSYSQDSLNLEGKRISNKASSETGCIASSDYCYSLKRTTSNNVHDVGSSLPVNTEFGSQMSWLLLNTINTVKTSSAEALKEERTKLEWITKPYKEQKICNFSKIREKKTINNHRMLRKVKNQILCSEDSKTDKDLSAEKSYSFPLSTIFNGEKPKTTIKEIKKKKVTSRKPKKKKSKQLMSNNVLFNNSHNYIHSETERSIEICETLISTDYIDKKNTIRSTECLRKTTLADNSSCSSTSRNSKGNTIKKYSNYKSSSISSSNGYIDDDEFKYSKENKNFLIRKHSKNERVKQQLYKKQNSKKLLLDEDHYKRKQFIVVTKMDDKMKIVLDQELQPQSYHNSTTVEQLSMPELIVTSSEMQTQSQQQFTPIFALSKIFSRRNARFELPVDKTRLIGMKPLEYLNEYVNVTNTYRLVYYRIFKLHARTIANAEYIEKTDELFDALACVVGRNFSEDQRKLFLDILDLSVTSGDSQLPVRIYFQTWCGISALCERIYGEFFAFKYLSRLEDPCTEMEEADFEFLEKKVANLHLDHHLWTILFKLRDC